MQSLKSKITRFIHSEDGPTAVEYAVLLALIVVTCIGTVNILANKTRNSMDTSAQALEVVL